MTSSRPNIILIITDQQRYDSIRALGYPYMDTPHLDKLVNEGASFTDCHITAPSCAPSRASLFTGYYPHVTGVMRNADLWQRSWVEELAQSGYHCVNVGKMHTFPFTTPLGFHERYVVENKDRYLEGRYFFDEWDKALKARGLIKQQRERYRLQDDYEQALGAFEWELPEDMHSDMFVGNTAQWWLRNYPKTEPLFLQIGFPGPHPPYDPTPEYAQAYLGRDLPEPIRDGISTQPSPYQVMRQHNVEVDHDSVVHQLTPSSEAAHKQRAYYYANVSMIDTQVGAIMQTLEDTGYLDNSVVIFTSDHGDALGDYGHSQKWTMYDVITRVPLVMWGQGVPHKTVNAQCQLMDVGQTILDLAGVTPALAKQACSLMPALKGDWEGREFVFAEHPPDGVYEGPYMTMVRSKTHKLVHFLGLDDGQLFDLRTDPQEITNLWHAPEQQAVKQRLLQALLEWRTQSAYETKDVFQDYR